MNNDIKSTLKKETTRVLTFIENYDNSEDKFYKSEPTAYMKAIAKYGAENIFMVSNSYRGCYHDDYASFKYYNNVTGETFEDSWTTAFACPCYDNYKCLTFKEAVKYGLVDMKKYLAYLCVEMKKQIEKMSPTPTFNLDELIKFKLPVTVKGGRKWRGSGYVVSKFTSKFGRRETTYAVIYDEDHNELREANSAFLNIIGVEELVKGWQQEMIGNIETATIQDLHTTADGNIQSDFFMSFEKWLEKKLLIEPLTYSLLHT